MAGPDSIAGTPGSPAAPTTASATNPATGGESVPRVSIIVPHLNTPAMLARCLESLQAQRLDRGHAEIIVVDNGSTTPLDAVRAQYPGVLFLSEPAPGPGLARNTGVARAAAPVLAFTDADCRAAPGWLQAAVDAVEATPAQPVGGDIRIDFVDPARLTGIEAYEAVFGFRQQMYIERKHFSVTANLAMAKPLHNIVGPFGGIDIAEDLDWGRRAHAAGHRTRYLPSMRVYHPARPDFAALERKWQRHVRHDWNTHVRAGTGAWRWRLQAGALILSVPVEGRKLLTSQRLSGIGNRLRGLGILARIRCARAAEMLRVMAAPVESGSTFWNRQA
jgi:glycosyltransferase involved in cell wall biosynthesis